MTQNTSLAFASFSAAAAWPWVVGALANLLMSPIERAARAAWCGMPFHSGAALLGHCPACWAGSALLALTGVLLLAAGDQPSLAVARKSARR